MHIIIAKDRIIQIIKQFFKSAIKLIRSLDNRKTISQVRNFKQSYDSIAKQLQNDKAINKAQIVDLKKQNEQKWNDTIQFMLKSQSKQKKLIGLSQINQNLIYEDKFYDWIKNNNLLDLVLQQKNDKIYAINAQIIFKTVLKNVKQNKAQLTKILQYVKNSLPEIRQCVLRFIQSVKFSQYYVIHNDIVLFLISDEGILLVEQASNIISKFVTKISNRTYQPVLDNLIHIYLENQQLKKRQNLMSKYKILIIDIWCRLLSLKISIKQTDSLWRKTRIIFKQILAHRASLNNIRLITQMLNKIIEKQGWTYYANRLVDQLITHQQIINKAIDWLKQSSFKQVHQSLQIFIQQLIKTSSQSIKRAIPTNLQLITRATGNINVFKNKMSYCKNSKQFKDQLQFENFIKSFYEQQNLEKNVINCIRHYFITMNSSNKIIQFQLSGGFQTKQIATSLLGVQNLIRYLFNAKNYQARDEIAQLVADIWTSYNIDIREQGQKYLMQKMNALAQQLGNQSWLHSHQEDNKRLLGILALAEKLMLLTQIQGIGKLKSHASLSATNFANVCIVRQSPIKNKKQLYQKRLPGNTYLSDVMKKFSTYLLCDIYDLKLMDGQKEINHKNYGLTIQQLKCHNRVLKVVNQSAKQFIRRQEIFINNKLTQKFVEALKQIFHRFAKNNILGYQQCMKFMQVASRCPIRSQNVSKFLKQNGDKNKNIRFQIFLKFYQDKAAQKKIQDIWKNLSNLGYRSNLQINMYARDSLPQKLMCRYYLSQKQQVYEILFYASKSDDQQLKKRSIQLLLRLPTYKQIFEDTSVVFKEINQTVDSFLMQYLLIGLNNGIKIGCETAQDLTKTKNLIRLNTCEFCYNKIKILYGKSNRNKHQQNSLLICLKLLRAITMVPNLKTYNFQRIVIQSQFKVQQTTIFMEMLAKNLQNQQIQILEWLLALQIAQIYSNPSTKPTLQFGISGIMSKCWDIRKITNSYIYIISMLGKDISPIFRIQTQIKCDMWYSALSKIIQRSNINVKQAYNYCLKIIQQKKVDLQNYNDPSIYGALSNIISILKKDKSIVQFHKIINIASKVIGQPNLKLLYQILSNIDFDHTILYLKQLVSNYELDTHKKLIPKSKFMGLKNFGSTCYINSILQVFFWINNFRNQLFGQTIQRIGYMNDLELQRRQVLRQIKKIYAFLKNGSNKSYDLTKFFKVYRDKRDQCINVKLQQDAHEFYGYFLDVLQTFFQKDHRKQIFESLFNGKILCEYICGECQNKIYVSQKFTSLNLVVKGCTNLTTSLKKYTKTQEIKDYYCEKCNMRPKKMSKNIYLKQLPDYLFINLKRIQMDLQKLQKIKINSKLEFPQLLDLSHYREKQKNQLDSSLFKLKAAIIHQGGAEQGHYYSFVNIQDKWYKFNDQDVTQYDDKKQLQAQGFGGDNQTDKVGKESSFSTNAYILCYERYNLQKNASKNSRIDSEVSKELKEQKQNIFDQLRVCNNVAFQSCVQLFNKIKPNGIQQEAKSLLYIPQQISKENFQNYSKLFDLSVCLLRFLNKYNDKKIIENIQKLGQQIEQLLYLMPEMSSQFLLETNIQQCIYMLCKHPEPKVKNIYNKILIRSLRIFYYANNFQFQQNQPVAQHVRFLILQLKKILDHYQWYQDFYKYDSFLQFWAACAETIQPIFKFMLKTDICLKFIVNIESAHGYKYISQMNEKPISRMYQQIYIIACKIIKIFVQYKQSVENNMSQKQQNQFKIGFQQQIIELSRPQLYHQIVDKEYDGYNKIKNLSKVISCISYKNQVFSRKITQFFLKGLQVYENNVDKMAVLLDYIQHFLKIQDQLSTKRMKWILGIAQFQMGDQLTYGFPKKQINSKLYIYASTLYFSNYLNYPTMLQKLVNQFLSGNYKTTTMYLWAFLINFSHNDKKILEYLCSLPSPCIEFIIISVVPWKLLLLAFCIYLVFGRYQDEFEERLNHDTFPKYLEMKQQLKIYQVQDNLLSQYIKGRNHHLQQVYKKQSNEYTLSIYVHQTYVVANMSPERVSYGFFQSSQSQYFISRTKTASQYKEMQANNLPLSIKAIISCQITTKEKPLRVTFNINNFKQQIYLEAGKNFINLPFSQLQFTEQTLNKYIQVQILDSKQINWCNQDFMNYNICVEYSESDNNQMEKSEKVCPMCTLICQSQQKRCPACQTKFRITQQ